MMIYPLGVIRDVEENIHFALKGFYGGKEP